MLKKYIFERLQDVEATKLAETVFNEIVFHKQKEVQEEFKNWGIIDFNTPDGIKLDSFEGVFSLKVINKFASSFYSPSKDDKLIVLTVVGYDKYNDMVDNLIRIIIDKKSTFIHEFIHMLDDIRSDGKIIKDPTNKEGGQKRYEKLNREVNARFHQIASAVKEKYIDKEIASIKKDYVLNRKKFENEFDFEGLSEKEKLNLVLVNSSEYVCNINYLVDLFKEEIFNFFHYKLNPNLEKRLLSRAYTYFSELIKSYDIDCSKKIKIIYENKMARNKINTLLETYESLNEDNLNEIIFSDSEGTNEKQNNYWLGQARGTLLRKYEDSINEIGKRKDLALDYPNLIFEIYKNTYYLVLLPKEIENSDEIENFDENKIQVLFSVKFSIFQDGIRLHSTMSNPNVRGQGLSLKIYQKLKEKYGSIYSDTTQSSFSRFLIWMKLYDINPNSIKAFNTKTSEYFDVIKNDNKLIYIDENPNIKDYKYIAKSLNITWKNDWSDKKQVNLDKIPEEIIKNTKYREVYTEDEDNNILLVYL